MTRAVCDERDRCALFARVTAAFVILFAALTIADLFAGGTITSTLIGNAGVSGQGRFQSLYENAGVFAGMLIVGFPLALVPALNDRTLARRMAWGAGVAVIVAGMLLSGSRAALVAALVASAAIAIAQRRWWLLGGAAAVALVLALMVGAGGLEGAPALERLQQIATRSGTGIRSLHRRELIWSVASDLIQRSPVIGWGGSQLRFHQHAGFNRAHNAWLDAWLDGGILAAIAMLIVTWQVLRRASATMVLRPARLLDPTHVALVASCLAVLTGWLVRAGLGSRIDWLPIFMLFGLHWHTAATEETKATTMTATTPPARRRGHNGNGLTAATKVRQRRR